MSDEPPASEALAFRRLHPATVLVEILRKLGSMLYLIIIALVVRLFGGEGDWFEYFITVLVGLSGGLSLARYISLRYGLDGDRLVIRSGIFQRQIRTIPIDKIQNINLKRNVLHRLLRVVDVKIETAVAGQTEAELSVLSERDASELRRELLRRRVAAAPQEQPVEQAAEIWSTTLKDLLIVGATENRAGVIVASIAGLYYTFLQDLGERVWKPVEGYLKELLGTSLDTAILVAVLGVVLLIVAGWVVSIALTIVGYYGFTLRRAEDRLRRRYGLFTQVESVVPLRRIQVLRLESPILRRLWGLFTVYAETAGSVSDRKSGGSTPLGPLVKGRDAGRFCRLAFPELDLDRVEWRPVSRLTIRRGFIRAAIVLLVPVGVLAAVLATEVLWALPAALALATAWAWARYRALGYAEIGSFVLARSGIWTRKIWVVPQGKVQSVSLGQSPFQRRLGLANLSIDTAGSRFLSGAEVVDLPYETALALQDRLSWAANSEGLWLPDGV
jgi:putative membrane protein